MAEFHMTVQPPEEGGGLQFAVQEENEVSVMLANALKKMDGLIGDYSPHPGASPLPQDPLAVSVVTQCETLKALVSEWEDKVKAGEGGGEEEEVRMWILPETKEFLISWLSNKKAASPLHLDQLQRDKEQLLKQIVTMETEAGQTARQLSELQVKLRESEARVQSLSEQLRKTKLNLEARETEITLLSREKEYWPSGYYGDRGGLATLSEGVPPVGSETTGRMEVDSFQRVEPQRRSIKKSIARAFSRKKSHTATLLTEEDGDTSLHTTNFRASAFQSKDRYQLGEWMETVGLEMYRSLVEQHVPSGDSLVAITTKPDNSDLVHIGIVSTLHCKKLRLAVMEATTAQPTPLGGLSHFWVAEWLNMIGLPQYVTTFSEARIDGHMLNAISMDDLQLLEVTDPFHLLSLQRAIQAFRLCGYNPNYLKNPAAASKGSQKLLHWTAQDVAGWLCGIDLDQYVGALQNRGLHGALMLLEVRFTSESLARLLGIQDSKTLIRKHLAKKFMEVLGPVAAQRKLDAMQFKSFQPIDPTDKGKAGPGGRARARKSRHYNSQEDLLCPLSEFPAPAAGAPRSPRPLSAPSQVPVTNSPSSTPPKNTVAS